MTSSRVDAEGATAEGSGARTLGGWTSGRANTVGAKGAAAEGAKGAAAEGSVEERRPLSSKGEERRRL